MNQDIRDKIEEVVKEAQKHKAEIMEAVNDKIESDKDLFKFFSRVEAGAGEDGRKKLIEETLKKFRKWGNSKGGRVELDKAELRAIEEFGEVEDLAVMFAIGNNDQPITQKQRDRIFRKMDKQGHKADLRHALACHNAILEDLDQFTIRKIRFMAFAYVGSYYTTLHDTQKRTEILATELAELIPADKQGEVDKIIKRYNKHTRPYGTLQRTETGDIEDVDKADSLGVALALSEKLDKLYSDYLALKEAYTEFIAENNAIRYLNSHTKRELYEDIPHPYQLQEQYIKRGNRRSKEAIFTPYEEIKSNEELKKDVKGELYRIYRGLAESYT